MDLNKIIYAKAEHLTSKKDGRVLQMFKLEIKDEAEAEALISQNLTCHTAEHNLQQSLHRKIVPDRILLAWEGVFSLALTRKSRTFFGSGVSWKTSLPRVE